MLSNSKENCSGSRSRVQAAIQRRETDRVPKGEICIDEAVVKTSLSVDKANFDNKLEFINKLGLDIVCLEPVYPEFIGRLPDPAEVRWSGLGDWVNTGLFSFAVLDGILGWGIKCFGFNQFLTLPNKSPLSIHSFTEKVTSLNIEMAGRLIDAGIDGLIIADDLAYRRGLLIKPRDMRRYVFSALQSQVAEMRRGGVPVFIHSDGNINEIIPDIIEAGFNGLHCIDRNSSMDILELQRNYGARLCFWGSLSAEDLIKAHDPGCLQGLLDTICAAAAKNGFILGTDCGLFKGIDLEGLALIYERVNCAGP